MGGGAVGDDLLLRTRVELRLGLGEVSAVLGGRGVWSVVLVSLVFPLSG